MNQCTACKEFKEVSEFPKRKTIKKGCDAQCKVCREIYQKAYRLKNKEKNVLYKKEYQKKNTVRLSAISKAYVENNREQIREYKREYNTRRRVLRKQRYDTDPFHKAEVLFRCGITRAFKLKGWGKQGTSKQLLGCDYETAKKHIERQFKKGMNWDNYGKYGWHVDHKRALSTAINLNELKELCHYTNLQPLWWRDNIIKSDKPFEHQIIMAI